MKNYAAPPEKMRHKTEAHQKRRRIQDEEPWGSRKMDLAGEKEMAGCPRREQHILGDAWELVKERVATIGTYLQNPHGGAKLRNQLRTERINRSTHGNYALSYKTP